MLKSTYRHRGLPLALFAVLVVSPMLLAQVSTGTLLGVAQDETAGVVPGVTITVTNVDTGTTRTLVTDEEGRYRASQLAAGTYEIQAELPGFRTQVMSGIRLSVGQEAVINLALQVGEVTERVTVTGQAPLVETTRSDMSSVLAMDEIQDLPLVGRDWLSMAANAPGVRSAGTGTPAMAGQPIYRTRVLVDGQKIDDSTNMTVTNMEYSQEAIREMRVVTNRMSAEYANAAGGVVTAVTKSGANALHGSVFGFFRDGSFNRKDFFTGEQEEFNNKVIGGTVGGPIIEDKLFYFANAEFRRRSQTQTSGTGIPEIDSTYPVDNSRDIVLLRFDYQINSNHQLNIRGAYNFFEQENVSVNDHPSNGWSFPKQSWQAGMQLTSIFGTRLVNDFGYQYFPTSFHRKLNSGFPKLIFPGAEIGTNTNSLYSNSERYNQVYNNVTYSRGQHSMKFGASLNYENVVGLFCNGCNGSYEFQTDPLDWQATIDVVNNFDRVELQNLVDQGIVPVPLKARQGIGNPSFKTPQRIWGVYFQDDWQVNPRLTLNLGLRWDADFGGFVPGVRSRYVTDDSHPEHDSNNIAPRLGFAYDLTGEGTIVIRGGAGRYYDRINNNVTFAHVVFNGDTLAQVVTFPGDPPRSDFMIDSLGGITLEEVIAGGALTDIRPLSPDIEVSWTDQLSIGVATELPGDVALTADFLHIIGQKEMTGQMDINVFCNTDTGQEFPVLEFGRPDTRYNAINIVRSEGHSRYEGLQFGLRRRFAGNYMFASSYTLSWSSADNGGLHFAGGASRSTPCDRDLLRGPSELNQRHRFNITSVYQLPYGFQLSGIIFATSGQRFLTTAGVDLTGNLNRRDLARCDLPGDQTHSGCSERGTWWLRAGGKSDSLFRVDLRVSKSFQYWKGQEDKRVELLIEFFNLFNRENFDPRRYQGTQSSGTFLQPRRSTDLNFQPFSMQLGFRFLF